MEDAAPEPAPVDGPERPVYGLLTNGRLRHKPRDGDTPVIEMGEMKLGRWFWVGGRLYIDDDRIRFAGTEAVFVGTDFNHRVNKIDYAVAVPGYCIEKVERRTGVVGVPYVAVTTIDGAELQLRSGIAGSKADLVIETIEAMMESAGPRPDD
ncbi:MAG: hypothetical protein AB8G14_11095 [Ilumatobacter sp.]